MNKNIFILFFTTISFLVSMEDNDSFKEDFYQIITTDNITDKIPKKHLDLSLAICSMFKDCPYAKGSLSLPINSEMLPILKSCLENNYILQNKAASIDAQTTAKNEIKKRLNTQAILYSILTFADQLIIPSLITCCTELWAQEEYIPSDIFFLPLQVNKNIAQCMKGSSRLLDYTAPWVIQELENKKTNFFEEAFEVKVNVLQSIDINNQGKLLAAGSSNNILIYNFEKETCSEIKSYNGVGNTILQFNKCDDNQIWSSGSTIKVWDLPTLSLVNAFTSLICQGSVFYHIPEYKTLIANSIHQGLLFWDLADENNNIPELIDAHTANITTLNSNYNGSLFVSASYDKFAHVWSTESKQILNSFSHNIAVTSAHFNHANNKLLCGLGRGYVILYDLITKKQLSSNRVHLGNISDVLFDKNDTLYCSGSKDATIKLLDVRAYQPLTTLFAHKSAICGLALNAQENKLASAAYDDAIIKIWDLRKLVEPIKNLRNEISDKCTIEHIINFTNNDVKKTLNTDDLLLTNFSPHAQKFLSDYSKK